MPYVITQGNRALIVNRKNFKKFKKTEAAELEPRFGIKPETAWNATHIKKKDLKNITLEFNKSEGRSSADTVRIIK